MDFLYSGNLIFVALNRFDIYVSQNEMFYDFYSNLSLNDLDL